MESNGVSILGDLVVFAVIILSVLKLAGIISISWWLVFLPLILTYGLGAVVFVIMTFLLLIYITKKGE